MNRKIVVALASPSCVVVSADGESDTRWFTVADVRELQLAIRRCQETQLRFEKERAHLTMESLPAQSVLDSLAAVDTVKDPAAALTLLAQISGTARNQAVELDTEAKLYNLATAAADEVAEVCAEYWAKFLGTNRDDVPGNLGFDSLVKLEDHVTSSPFDSLTTQEVPR